MINADDTTMDDILDRIVTNGNILPINQGTYSNIIDLGKGDVASQISLGNVVIPTNSRMEFRARYSNDQITWSSWTDWQEATTGITFATTMNSAGRYFQYEVRLFGNENFESPTFDNMEIDYYDSKSFSIFFQPIDLDINSDEYLASIHITHQATMTPTSEITYGVAQFNSVDIADYESITRSELEPDRHSIQLARFNERFITTNYITYTAINGRWPTNATVEVRRSNSSIPNGEAVDSSTYTVNSNEGTITFNNTQNLDDTYTLNVFFDPVFRIV